MTERTILITGGLGYLGRRFTRHLKEDGFNVLALANNSSEDPAECDVIHADITDRDALDTAFSRKKIDAIIHLAAVSEVICANDPVRSFHVNCFGTKNVLDAARAAGIRRVVFMSSFHVYGRSSGTINEQTVPVPTHPYGITKLVGELFCRDATKKGLEVAIIRSSNGVGVPLSADTDRWKLIVLDLCRQAHEKKKLTLISPGHVLRDFISIDDQYQAVRILLDGKIDEDPVYDISSGSTITTKMVTEMIVEEYKKLYGVTLPVEIPDSDERAIPLHYGHEKIARLGFTPKKSLREDIKEILQFCERFR